MSKQTTHVSDVSPLLNILPRRFCAPRDTALWSSPSEACPSVPGIEVANWNMDPTYRQKGIELAFPMDPSTFLGSVWGIIYYHLEA